MSTRMSIFSPFKRNLSKEPSWEPTRAPTGPWPQLHLARSGGTAQGEAGSRAGVQGPTHGAFPFPGSQLACGFYVQGYLFSNQRH